MKREIIYKLRANTRALRAIGPCITPRAFLGGSKGGPARHEGVPDLDFDIPPFDCLALRSMSGSSENLLWLLLGREDHRDFSAYDDV